MVPLAWGLQFGGRELWKLRLLLGGLLWVVLVNLSDVRVLGMHGAYEGLRVEMSFCSLVLKESFGQ